MIAIGEALPVATPLGGREFSRWPRRIRTLGYILVVLSLASSFATFALLMGLTPIDPTGEVVVSAMAVNGALVGVLALAVGWEIVTLVRARRKGRAAARLHIRVVALFSIIAAVPAILVALAASFTLNRGLDHWFSERTRQIVSTSQQIALAFAEEQARSLRTDILTLRLDFERAQPLLEADPDQFQTFMNSVAAFRGIPGLYLVKPDGSMIAQADFQFKLAFVPPPPEALDQAKAGSDPVLIAPGATRIVGALIRLQSYRDVLLYVSREIDPKVVRYINMTTDNINEYRSMEQTRFAVQVAFGLLYLGISLVVLLSAIWLGIGFANRIVSPIRRLIDASDQVARGNLAVEVPYRSADGDIGALGQTFNTMTAELRRQQAELVAANGLIDSRRRFTEAVLAGVSAGVVGVDADGKVTLANRGGLRFLGVADESGAIGRPIAELVPELTDVVAVALVDQGRTEHRDQIALVRDGRERTLNVRVTTERSESDAHGYVVTLDDITDLMTAQRGAAWADIARRIAHEIKNPLTPIQLSAERLRRRFGKTVGEGREVFDQCVDTIIRQVGDIGRMVDEFSAFARMPKPAMEARDLRDPVREAVFLLEVGHPDIEFRIDLPAQPMVGRFDTRLVSQVFTNVVKNATEAIAALPAEARGTPRITVAGRVEGDQIVVDVIDTGIGLPAENRQRLLEPYMTTREKGTGLGLAIVRKILEEHGGRIDLLDAPQVAEGGHGAMVRITLPKSEAPLPEPAREAAA